MCGWAGLEWGTRQRYKRLVSLRRARKELKKLKMIRYQCRSTRHLSLFGIRCNIATDDIFFPTILSFALKATWLFVALGTAIYLFLHPGCTAKSPPLLSISIIGFMVLQLAAVTNDIFIMIVSNQGSLRNFAPRKNIDIFLYIGFAIYLCQIVWDIFSTCTIFSPQVIDEQLTNCTAYATAVTMYKVVVLSYWGVLVFLFGMYAILMDPCSRCLLSARLRNLEDDIIEVENARNKKRELNSNDYPIHSRKGAHTNKISCSTWLRQLCGKYNKTRGHILTPKEQAISDFAATFKVLLEDVDYVFLDIVAGLKLVSLYHEKMRDINKDPTDLIKEKTVDALKAYENYEPPSNPKELTTSELQKHVGDLKYYLTFAMASYGWPIHVYLHPVQGPLSLCINARCNCCCASCQEPHFEGNQCFPNQAAIKAMTGIRDEDIITASFVNAVHIVPFYVVKVERNGQKEVIIAIRGTLSIKDALTDVSACLCQADDDLLGIHPSFVHRGFYQAALGIYEHIMDNETFKDLVISKRYKLVLTGHSLGAAVSSVLAVLLKHKHPEWTENLRAINFATPPVFNYPLAKETDDFIISVVSGYDVVPRMTIRGLGHLIMSVADLIDNSHHSKQSILCCSGRCGWEPDIDVEAIEARQAANLNELKLPNTETDDNHDQHNDHTALTDNTRERKRLKFRRSLLMKQLALLVAKEDTGRASSEEANGPMVFTPGQIIHLEVTEVDKMKVCCSCGLKEAGKVKASWKAREELSGIQIHDSMLLDHGPTRTIDFVSTLSEQVEELNSNDSDKKSQ